MYNVPPDVIAEVLRILDLGEALMFVLNILGGIFERTREIV